MANASIPHQSVSWDTLKSKDSSLQEIRDNLVQLNIMLLFSHNDVDSSSSSASSCYPSSSALEGETTSPTSGLLSLDELKALVSCGFHHFTQFDVALCLLGVFLQQKKQGILKKRGKNFYRESGVYRYAIKVLTLQCPHEVFALVLSLMRYEGSSPVEYEDIQQHLCHEHYDPETFCGMPSFPSSHTTYSSPPYLLTFSCRL
jgi:hypothetical protein